MDTMFYCQFVVYGHELDEEGDIKINGSSYPIAMFLCEQDAKDYVKQRNTYCNYSFMQENNIIVEIP